MFLSSFLDVWAELAARPTRSIWKWTRTYSIKFHRMWTFHKCFELIHHKSLFDIHCRQTRGSLMLNNLNIVSSHNKQQRLCLTINHFRRNYNAIERKLNELLEWLNERHKLFLCNYSIAFAKYTARICTREITRTLAHDSKESHLQLASRPVIVTCYKVVRVAFDNCFSWRKVCILNHNFVPVIAALTWKTLFSSKTAFFAVWSSPSFNEIILYSRKSLCNRFVFARWNKLHIDACLIVWLIPRMKNKHKAILFAQLN